MAPIFSSVRARLLALSLVASIPVAGIAGSSALSQYGQSIAELTETAALLRDADTIRHATALDDLRALVSRLNGFADFPSLPPAECTDTLRRLRGIFEARYSDLWLLNGEGRLICNAYGTPPGTPFNESSYFRRSLSSGGYALGDFVLGPSSQRPVLPAGFPVREDGRLVAVAGGAILLDWFRESNQRHDARDGHMTWLLDPAGVPLAIDGQAADKLPASALIEQLRASSGPLTRIGDSAGGEAYAYSISAPDRGMRVMVALPAAEARREAWRTLMASLAQLALFLAACLLAIMYGAELSCSRPLRRLAGRVRAWQPGSPFAAPRSQWDPDEVVALGDAVTGAAETISAREAELNGALHQRDLLLAEIHHRVKNNLQIVASLLNMHGERIEDAGLRAEFETARNRVQALSTLHRHLYMQGDIAAVALVPLLHELAAQVVTDPGSVAPDIRIEADQLVLPSEQATSFALLVAEALANAVKHAFPASRPGRIAIRLKQRPDGMVELEIRDDGVGLPEQPPVGTGMGLTLIRGFAAHLGGEVELERAGGTRLRVTFPAPEAPAQDSGAPASSPASARQLA